MIQSSLGSGEATWKDSSNRCDELNNSIEKNFSNMSLVSNNTTGNRPPTLSSSSISTYGEDASGSNKFMFDNGFGFAPTSPLTPSSSSFSPVGLKGKGVALNGDMSIRTPVTQSSFKHNQDNNKTYHEMKFEASNRNIFHRDNKEDILWNPSQDNDFIPHFAQNRTINKSDATGTWTTSGNVIASPGSKSNASIPNMDSVDENEQFLGHRVRSRTLSSSTSYHSHAPLSSSEHLFVNSGHSFIKPQIPSSNQQFCNNVLIPSLSPSGQISAPRQRMMSADDAGRMSVGEMEIRSKYSFHDNGINQQQTLIHGPSSMGNLTDNRQRSLSSNAIYGHSHINGLAHYQTHCNSNKQMSYPHQTAIKNNDYSGLIVQNVAIPMRYYPSNGLISGTSGRVIYTVKFKRSQKNFVLSPQIQTDIKIGSYVKVEADRGFDLGIVLSRVPIEQFNLASRTTRHGGIDHPSSQVNIPEMKKILSLATNDEIQLLALKKEEEEELLKICKGKALQRGLSMNLVDAEYQFDRHKLTFFFEAKGRIDFRDLVRELFSIYKTRIWMQQIDKNLTNTNNITPSNNTDTDGIGPDLFHSGSMIEF